MIASIIIYIYLIHSIFYAIFYVLLFYSILLYIYIYLSIYIYKLECCILPNTQLRLLTCISTETLYFESWVNLGCTSPLSWFSVLVIVASTYNYYCSIHVDRSYILIHFVHLLWYIYICMYVVIVCFCPTQLLQQSFFQNPPVTCWSTSLKSLSNYWHVHPTDSGRWVSYRLICVFCTTWSVHFVVWQIPRS